MTIKRLEDASEGSHRRGGESGRGAGRRIEALDVHSLETLARNHCTPRSRPELWADIKPDDDAIAKLLARVLKRILSDKDVRRSHVPRAEYFRRAGLVENADVGKQVADGWLSRLQRPRRNYLNQLIDPVAIAREALEFFPLGDERNSVSDEQRRLADLILRFFFLPKAKQQKVSSFFADEYRHLAVPATYMEALHFYYATLPELEGAACRGVSRVSILLISGWGGFVSGSEEDAPRKLTGGDATTEILQRPEDDFRFLIARCVKKGASFCYLVPAASDHNPARTTALVARRKLRELLLPEEAKLVHIYELDPALKAMGRRSPSWPPNRRNHEKAMRWAGEYLNTSARYALVTHKDEQGRVEIAESLLLRPLMAPNEFEGVYQLAPQEKEDLSHWITCMKEHWVEVSEKRGRGPSRIAGDRFRP